MVKIRLRRMGRRNRPFYRIVVADSRAPRDGKYIETVGQYDPKDKSLRVKRERIDYWLLKGAKPTDTVEHLLTRLKTVEPKQGGAL